MEAWFITHGDNNKNKGTGTHKPRFKPGFMSSLFY
jgi:hypothetical protein